MSFKHIELGNTYFLINAIKKACEKHTIFFIFYFFTIKKACEKHIVLKEYVLLTC